MARKTVAILGGGVGGLVAANRLRKLLSREHRVVLIDRSVWHSVALAYAAVMLGEKVAGRISGDLRRLNRKGIEFTAAEITGIDLSGKTISFDGQELAYDRLRCGTQYYVLTKFALQRSIWLPTSKGNENDSPARNVSCSRGHCWTGIRIVLRRSLPSR